jgi:hypothetical protein
MQCRERFFALLDMASDFDWTEEQDQKLRELVDQLGLGNWDAISSGMKEFSAIQCARRWRVLKMRPKRKREEVLSISSDSEDGSESSDDEDKDWNPAREKLKYEKEMDELAWNESQARRTRALDARAQELRKSVSERNERLQAASITPSEASTGSMASSAAKPEHEIRAAEVALASSSIPASAESSQTTLSGPSPPKRSNLKRRKAIIIESDSDDDGGIEVTFVTPLPAPQPGVAEVKIKDEVEDFKMECMICSEGGMSRQMIMCEECCSFFHFRCVGLYSSPDEEWFCPECVNSSM